MKNILIFFLISVSAAAQVPFEKLDSLSTVVSQWQKMTEATTYKDSDGQIRAISFPAENFQIWSSDRLASKAVYKKNNDLEFLELTENIDLSKATGISVSENYFGSAYIKVDFPAGQLKTQIIENGVLRKTLDQNYLEFFCRYGAIDANKKFYFDLMFDMVYAICNMMKVEKGMVDIQTITAELTDWNKLSNEAFLLKHPKSLMATQAQLNIQEAQEKNKR